MADDTTPFDSLESAHRYVALLCDAVTEARLDVGVDAEAAVRDDAGRRLEALKLVAYKLDRLERHLESSRRLLNDLRMLRRVLLSEATAVTPSP